MLATWGERGNAFLANSKQLKNVWLVLAALMALYVGALRSREGMGGIANSRATGLAESQPEPMAFWQQESRPQETIVRARLKAAGIVGGVPAAMTASLANVEDQDKSDDGRKMVRTSSIDLVVKHPAEAALAIQQVAERLGGFLVNSQMSGGEGATNGSLTVRVPADRFEEARAEIRKIGLKIDSERIDAQDVTRQYVDEAAHLRNLRAEEQQYLSILKQAHTVKDTLEVSEKIGEVRGQIEQQQAEFETLSKQIETVSITVSLRAETEAKVFGLNWRPLYQMKLALREGLDGLATYFLTMTQFVFFLPAVLLWFATIVAVTAVGWRILRWAGRKAFRAKPAVTATPA